MSLLDATPALRARPDNTLRRLQDQLRDAVGQLLDTPSTEAHGLLHAACAAYLSALAEHRVTSADAEARHDEVEAAYERVIDQIPGTRSHRLAVDHLRHVLLRPASPITPSP